ncbi:MAG: RNA polymerase sigma factor [Pseudomonadota bacterium]
MIVAFAPQTGTGQLARVRHSQNQPIERRCKIADGGRNVMPTPATQPRDVMTPDQFKTEMIGLLPRLRRFALTLTRSGPDADDLLQDACTTALQKWQQYDPSQPFDRWMFRVIRNLWISEIRKRKVRQGEGQIDAEEANELQTAGSAEETLTAQQVRRKVADLDQDLAQPLMLVCSEGYSYKEVSELLNIPIGTVMSRIHRARKLLVSHLSVEESLQS